MQTYSIEWLLAHEDSFRYQLLDRMRCDCNFFLGYANRNPEKLWAGSVKEQIAYMKALWHSFSDEAKPEWLSMEQIEALQKAMEAPVLDT